MEAKEKLHPGIEIMGNNITRGKLKK